MNGDVINRRRPNRIVLFFPDFSNAISGVSIFSFFLFFLLLLLLFLFFLFSILEITNAVGTEEEINLG